ncbi:MAG: hemolysin III family protein [Andreesenia angusta]|nr:hemolysin III family protein [Andreesenia angusta]
MSYSYKEEIFNSITHGIGTLFGFISTALLLYKPIVMEDYQRIIAFSIYGICTISMFLSSTIYHGIQNRDLKKFFRVFDHSAIFLCIAGTYTPIFLIALDTTLSKVILGIIWLCAIIGIGLKIINYLRGSFDKRKALSLAMYLIMGWIAVFFIPQLVKSIGLGFFIYILVGGLLYSIGAYFYKNRKIKLNHGIWHIFILLATVSQFIAIYKYLR